MDATAPSHDIIRVLRTIAQSGFEYHQANKLGQSAGWRLVDDEPGLGFLAFGARLVPTNAESGRRLVVEIDKNGHSPRAFIPLFNFEEYDNGRDPFDQAFQSISNQLVDTIEIPSKTGEYTYPHRKGWTNSFAWWRFDDAAIVLVQDEFYIQFGMDVSLWVLPANTPVTLPVSRVSKN